MPGWVLVVGLNAYLAKYHTGLTASWGFGRKKLWNRMSAMLSHDIPVILSIGPNLPFFRKKEKLNLYQKKLKKFKNLKKLYIAFFLILVYHPNHNNRQKINEHKKSGGVYHERANHIL